MFVSETYALQDCIKYDDASVDNTSKYDTTSSSNQTFSYDSTEQAYKLQRTSDGFGSVLASNVSVDTKMEVSFTSRI